MTLARVPLTGVALARARLRYFRDLLALCVAHVHGRADGAESLHRRRLAVGLDHPDLDVVPLWSHRVGEDRVALACSSFIAEEISKSLDELKGEPDGMGADVQRKLAKWTGGDPARATSGAVLPLRDLETMAAKGGLLDQAANEGRDQLDSVPQRERFAHASRSSA